MREPYDNPTRWDYALAAMCGSLFTVIGFAGLWSILYFCGIVL